MSSIPEREEPPIMFPGVEPQTVAEALYFMAMTAAVSTIGADHRPAWYYAKRAAEMLGRQP